MVPTRDPRPARPHTWLATASCLILIFALAPQTLIGNPAEFWPHWRGPLATGSAPAGNPPLRWSETENVRWKIAIPGRGKSTPVVWEDRVYLTTAVPAGTGDPAPHAFAVLAVNRADGSIVWQRTVREAVPHEGTHQDGSFASGSVITDGERLYAFFGSRGLYALDLDGNVIWDRDLGPMQVQLALGEGSSPALHGDTLVVNMDHEGQSFIVAVDTATGRDRWRVLRDERTSWATPIIVEQDGRVQVITAASGAVRSYDLDTGALIWQGPGTTLNAIPSPVAGDGVVYVAGGFRGSVLRAIRVAGAEGDITGTSALLWEQNRNTPFVSSPLLHHGVLYMLRENSGVLTTFDTRTGEPHYTERIDGIFNVYASPVGVGERVYVTGREGTTVVLRHGQSYELLATNSLDDGFDASPAIAGSDLFLRGQQYLYRIAE
jgi:outer membrane protein assembly factor BamB